MAVLISTASGYAKWGYYGLSGLASLFVISMQLAYKFLCHISLTRCQQKIKSLCVSVPFCGSRLAGLVAAVRPPGQLARQPLLGFVRVRFIPCLPA